MEQTRQKLEFTKPVEIPLVPVQSHHQYASAVNVYRREQMLNLSPVEVVLKLYDTAIISCKKNDLDLARKALNELIAGLNFDYRDISLGLFRLYDYCKLCIRKQDVDEAVNILEDLRGTWAQAFHL
jgi:flagellin-specific chaperone FliS